MKAHMPETFSPELVFVDGENFSRLDIAGLSGRFDGAHCLLYQTTAAAKKRGYPGFEHVVVPHIGKESVDKCIAMDAVAAWYEGVRRVAIASNDRDYGATALHLKAKFPALQLMLVCDPARVSRSYMERLTACAIKVAPVAENEDVDLFAAQVIEVIYGLERQKTLNLAVLGNALRRRGVDYGRLANELERRNLARRTGRYHVEITDATREAVDRLRGL